MGYERSRTVFAAGRFHSTVGACENLLEAGQRILVLKILGGVRHIAVVALHCVRLPE